MLQAIFVIEKSISSSVLLLPVKIRGLLFKMYLATFLLMLYHQACIDIWRFLDAEYVKDPLPAPDRSWPVLSGALWTPNQRVVEDLWPSSPVLILAHYQNTHQYFDTSSPVFWWPVPLGWWQEKSVCEVHLGATELTLTPSRKNL